MVWRAMKLVAGAAYAACVCSAVQNHLIDLVICEEDSMFPTIDNTTKNNVLLVELVSRRRQRRDVVILKQPDSPQDLICKRITLISGDRVPRKGLVSPCHLTVVPRGHVWVEGDNKRSSYDSRDFGPVPLALVQGRVVFKVWPLGDIGWIH